MTSHTNARELVELAQRSRDVLPIWLWSDTRTKSKRVERLRHYYNSTLDRTVSHWVEETEKFDEHYTCAALQGSARDMTITAALEQLSDGDTVTRTYVLRLARGKKELRIIRLQETVGPTPEATRTEGHLSARKGYDALLRAYLARS